MPVTPRGNSFQVTVGSGANRYRELFKDPLEAAQALLDETKRRKLGGPPKTAPVLAPMKTLNDAFRLTSRLHWQGEKAFKTNMINATAVLDYLGADTPLASITTEEVTNMVIEFEDLGNSGSTVNKKASCLRMMFKTAEAQGWLDKWPNPPARKESKHRIRWVDYAEEDRLLALCAELGLDDLRDYIMVAIDTGFRRGEMLGLTPQDFSDGLLHLHAGTTKSDEARSVPATRRVIEVIQRRSSGTRVFAEVSIGSLRADWEKVRSAMGMTADPQFVVHMLRHTCASRLVQRAVPLAMVQRWMGHRKIETTLRYAHLAPDSLLMGRDALERSN